MEIPQFKLTVHGETYIKKICEGNGTSQIKGINNYALPYCKPESKKTVWESNIGGISTNQQLATNLINWYNEYSDQCKIDANFLAAQTFVESGYKTWNYSKTGSMGISQFIPATIYDVLIKNNQTMDRLSNITMTTEDKNAILLSIPTNIAYDINTYRNTSILEPWREILFQNIIDNPKIMIKMQFRYMKFIANKYPNYPNNSLASIVLFGYNRGPNSYIKKSYSASIDYAKKNGGTDKKTGKSYEEEGINYVYKIFKLLYEKFGYNDLNMNIPTSQFDAFKATQDDPS